MAFASRTGKRKAAAALSETRETVPHFTSDPLIHAPELEDTQEKTFQQRILKTYFVRFHMGLILTSVVATGVLGSRLLLYLGIRSLELRYPIAVLLSYGVFLVSR